MHNLNMVSVNMKHSAPNWLFGLIYLVLLIGGIATHACNKTPVDVATIDDENRCFNNPQDAVTEIALMLRNENWKELASYYDLKGSQVERGSLVSGEFFIRHTRPKSAHPGGFWRYRHPFAPEFDFGWVERSEDSGDIVEVIVTIEIDQGGGMMQRGIDSFLMRESDCGYRILPDD